MSALLSAAKATSRVILNTTRRIQGRQAQRLSPFSFQKALLIWFRIWIYTALAGFFDPSSAFRKATDPFQNPLKQVYLDLPCWTLIELEGKSILNRIRKGKHKGLRFPRIIFRTQETCCVQKLFLKSAIKVLNKGTI